MYAQNIITDKESALRVLEATRKEYLEEARMAARKIALSSESKTCTVDEVREVCPPPKDIDGRVMGAIFNSKDWEMVGFERSKRKTCHKRPISRFALKH